MKHRDFKDLIKGLKPNDKVRICYRGNVGNIAAEGLIFTVDENGITLNHGFTHKWQRVVSIISFL